MNSLVQLAFLALVVFVVLSKIYHHTLSCLVVPRRGARQRLERLRAQLEPRGLSVDYEQPGHPGTVIAQGRLHGVRVRLESGWVRRVGGLAPHTPIRELLTRKKDRARGRIQVFSDTDDLVPIRITPTGGESLLDGTASRPLLACGAPDLDTHCRVRSPRPRLAAAVIRQPSFQEALRRLLSRSKPWGGAAHEEDPFVYFDDIDDEVHMLDELASWVAARRHAVETALDACFAVPGGVPDEGACDTRRWAGHIEGARVELVVDTGADAVQLRVWPARPLQEGLLIRDRDAGPVKTRSVVATGDLILDRAVLVQLPVGEALEHTLGADAPRSALVAFIKERPRASVCAGAAECLVQSFEPTVVHEAVQEALQLVRLLSDTNRLADTERIADAERLAADRVSSGTQPASDPGH